MRRLAEVIAVNKKERAVIEADAEVSVRQSQLDAAKLKSHVRVLRLKPRRNRPFQRNAGKQRALSGNARCGCLRLRGIPNCVERLWIPS